ncbi:MAG: hypothetical protein ACRD3W_06170, partial [Terriglobales bacterium]
MGQEQPGRNIWEEKISDLRRYDLDNLDTEPINPADITSWPVPNLTFVRVDGILRSWDIEREKQQQQQQPQQDQDPNKPPKRMYLMEDAITGLHSQRANLAYLVLGNKTGVYYYMGISLPAIESNGNGGVDNSSAMVSYSSLKSILHSVYNGVDIYKDPFTSDTIKSMIAPLANNIGVITGIPALKSTGGDTTESEQIERLASGLQGHDFGMLILAVPIPSLFVNKEEFSV